MFAGWGSWVARFRWPVLAVALVAVISAGVWGLGVFGQLSEGGYNDPNSESTRAGEVVQEAFGARGGDLVVIYTPTKGKIDDAALSKRIRDRLAALPKSAVTKHTSYWNQKSAQYAAKDKSNAIAVITLAGEDDGAKLDAYREIRDSFAVEGAEEQLAGGVVLNEASSSRSTSDLARAELLSLPVVLILLLFLFGSLVAAALPVLVGGAAVLGSLGILHAIASVHEVNSFAVNVASLLGLGMAIDYGLFMVGRFREEQALGHPPAEAVRRTVATAGRTVVFSATLLMIALAGLLLFPQGFLQSLAYGGLAAVLLAAVLSLTLLPAMLALLGPRVDKIPVRLPGRTRQPGQSSGWARLAGFVLRRPVLVVIPILAVLVLLAAPIRGAHFGESDERILPAGDPARTAVETLQADYPQFTGDGVQIVLRGEGDAAGYAVAARQVPGIAQLTTIERAGDVALFTATLDATDPFSDEARDVVDALRSLPVPDGLDLLVGGTTARNVDSLSATADRLPLMVGLLIGATLLLMFLAFGSILLPIKAVVMSALSLSATFGLLVWIFQEGHGAGLLNVTPAPLEVGIVVLMAAVVFGLSTDYEVFLLSRMVEARARGADTAEAVTTGLARTGRVISAAAVLLIVVTGAFALSTVTTMRFVGVGMIIALLLDATVVRMLLVPAVLGLLGSAAWWAPGPLRRLQQRAGLAEHAGEEAAGGRHAAAVSGAVSYSAAPKPSWDRPPAELPALPAAAVPLALPAGSTDVTEVIPKVVDAEPSSTTYVSAAAESAAGEDSASEDTVAVDSASISEASAAGESASASSSEDSDAASTASAVPASVSAGSASAGTPAEGSVPDEAAPDEDTPDDAAVASAPAASTSAGSVPADSVPAGSDDEAPKPVESRPAAAASKPFGGLPLPAAPVIVGTASAGRAQTGHSAQDEFFFSSSTSTYGAPLAPPVIKPPTPWELPALTAGPASADPASEPEPGLDETRSLEAPDLDATQRFLPPDLADTRQMPAPLLRSDAAADDSTDEAGQPEPHLASAETSQRIFTRTTSDPSRAATPTPPSSSPSPSSSSFPAPSSSSPEGEEPDLDVTRSLEAPDLDATQRFLAPDLEDTRQMPAPLTRRPDPAPASTEPEPHLSSAETSQRIFTRPASPDDQPPTPAEPKLRAESPAGSDTTPETPAATWAEPEPASASEADSTEEPDLDVTRSLEAPDLDATQRFLAPDLADTRQMPAPLLRKPESEPEADAEPESTSKREPHLASAETSQRIFTRPSSDPSRVAAAPQAESEPTTEADADEEPDLDVTRSLEAPDLDATQRLVPPDLAATRHLPAPLIKAARAPKPKADEEETTSAPPSGSTSRAATRPPSRAANGPASPTPAAPSRSTSPSVPVVPPTRPGTPPRSKTPTVPVIPAGPATPTGPGITPRSTTPAEPRTSPRAAAAVPATPTGPRTSPRTPTPADPATPPGAGTPGRSTAPAARTTPAGPATPPAPTGPTRADVPGRPPRPTTRKAPANPAAPRTPNGPVTPAVPTRPTTPPASTGPAAPSVPAGPATPSVPAGPATPSVPTGPATPSVPTGPATPSVPTGPATPSVPARPAAAAPAAPADVPAQRRSPDAGDAMRRPADLRDAPPVRRPASLGDAPPPRRPATAGDAAVDRRPSGSGGVPAQRRPEDRGSAPATPLSDDLADIPARRKPEELSEPMPLRRPATLGDRPYSYRQPTAESSSRPTAEPQRPAESRPSWESPEFRSSGRPTGSEPARPAPPAIPRTAPPAEPTHRPAPIEPAWQPRPPAAAESTWHPTPPTTAEPTRQPTPPASAEPTRQPTPPATAEPAWQPPAEARPADPAAGGRRPNDLRDHLRESRPADLAQYSRRGQPGRNTLPPADPTADTPRRPASLGDLQPPSRPARRPADEPADNE